MQLLPLNNLKQKTVSIILVDADDPQLCTLKLAAACC